MGNSLRAAQICERTTLSRQLGIQHIPRKLHGFDTFSGFASPDDADKHPTWQGSRFSKDLEVVQKRFRNDSNISLHKVDVTELADSEGLPSENPKLRLKSDKVAIALFDMDLGEPTFRALCYLKPHFQEGTILIFDEFNAFRSAEDRGERGALSRFLSLYPRLKMVKFLTYGDGGQAFQISTLS